MVQKTNQQVKILETFRDALQSIPEFVPTIRKVELINSLLEVDFDILDIGSFVSKKLVPQFKDMDDVIKQIQIKNSSSRIFILTATPEGAKQASRHQKINIVGYPFSTSPTFLKKNINRNFEESWADILKIQNICQESNKELMVYMAMAFGNPYGDPVNPEIILSWTEKLCKIGVSHISLSDIVGVASPLLISEVYQALTTNFPGIEFGIHLHTKPNDWEEKIDAAFSNGCSVFDGVISGKGGCPMTGYEMLGNLPSQNLIGYFEKKKITLQIKAEKFDQALLKSNL